MAMPKGLKRAVVAIVATSTIIALVYLILGEWRDHDRYENADMGFSIRLPVDMEQLETEKQSPVGSTFGLIATQFILFDTEEEVGFSRKVGSLKRDFQTIFISTSRLPERPPQNFPQAILLESLTFIRNSPFAAQMIQYEELEPPTELDVHGMPGARMRYSYIRGDKLYQIVVAVITAERAYKIVWYSGFEHKQATDRLCSEMLHSMKFMHP
jgi:hypothetical protein